MHLVIALLFGVCYLFPQHAFAIPAITCHCFQDRSYTPDAPFKADPYFLATAQNSFFAAAFGVEKKRIVIKKQMGNSSDELWVAYWIASQGVNVTPEGVLQARQENQSWPQIMAAARISDKQLGGRLAGLVKSNASTSTVAAGVVETLLIRRHLLAEPEVAALRSGGANNQELILALLIATRTRQPALQIYREAKQGAKSWGLLLQQARIPPETIPGAMQALTGKTAS